MRRAMEWVVSLETAGDFEPGFTDEVRRLAWALRGQRAAVELREHGYGTTLVIDCDDPQEALSIGVATLRAAERRVGIAGLPVVSAEVTAASELADAPVPRRTMGVEHLGSH